MEGSSGAPVAWSSSVVAAGDAQRGELGDGGVLLYPKRMETVDDEIRDLAIKFVDKAKADGKPFFLWLNPTRMHIVTHLSEKYQACAIRRMAGPCKRPAWPSSTTIVGATMQKLKDLGVDDNTIVVFTTDNGTETSPGQTAATTPFKRAKRHDL